MPRKARKLSYEEHVILGLKLKQANRLLFESGVELFNRLGKTSPPAQKIARVIHQLANLRAELDSLISTHCPDRSNAELNRVYYGPEQKGSL